MHYTNLIALYGRRGYLSICSREQPSQPGFLKAPHALHNQGRKGFRLSAFFQREDDLDHSKFKVKISKNEGKRFPSESEMYPQDHKIFTGISEKLCDTTNNPDIGIRLSLVCSHPRSTYSGSCTSRIMDSVLLGPFPSARRAKTLRDVVVQRNCPASAEITSYSSEQVGATRSWILYSLNLTCGDSDQLEVIEWLLFFFLV